MNPIRFASPFVVFFLLWSVQAASGGLEDGRLDIYWVDVEGGAATLMVTPAGESILVDTGLPRLKHVKRIEEAILKTAKLKQLDHLIISHYDIDHHGGAAMLSRSVPVKTVYDNGKGFDGQVNDPGEEYFSFECDKRVVLNPGDTIPLKEVESSKESALLELKCIATRRTFIDPPKGAAKNETACASKPAMKDPDASENRNSMVLILKLGDFRFYNATDLTWNLEAKLVCPVDLVGPIDVYQTTHHGLDRSNNPLVLRTVRPTVAVMNNGKKKGTGPEMVTTLRSIDSIKAIYQAHKCVRSDGDKVNTGDELIANIDKDQAGNLIVLSVAPDGSSYRVTIPAKHYSREFKTWPK